MLFAKNNNTNKCWDNVGSTHCIGPSVRCGVVRKAHLLKPRLIDRLAKSLLQQ